MIAFNILVDGKFDHGHDKMECFLEQVEGLKAERMQTIRAFISKECRDVLDKYIEKKRKHYDFDDTNYAEAELRNIQNKVDTEETLSDAILAANDFCAAHTTCECEECGEDLALCRQQGECASMGQACQDAYDWVVGNQFYPEFCQEMRDVISRNMSKRRRK